MSRAFLGLACLEVGRVFGGKCMFSAPPNTRWAWDEECRRGDLGCNADGKHVQCRFCGEEPYAPCPATGIGEVPGAADNATTCTFKVPPMTRWTWDTSCRHGDLGCSADGVHVPCRFCGEGPFVDCPGSEHSGEEDIDGAGSTCTFKVTPRTKWMWDTTCTHGDLGCNADNTHVHCRFCGEPPYVACPGSEGIPQVSDNATSCTFTNPPKIASTWDPSCKHGDTGCNADGLHVACRFCGEEPYVPCPNSDSAAKHCDFKDTPRTNWVWDPTCKDGDIGCKADGVSTSCRFCGEEPYGPCPACEFTLEPEIPYVWDSKCEPLTYTKGCFADSLHFQCRFCGSEGFDPCPTTTVTTASTSPAPESRSTTSDEPATDSSTPPASSTVAQDVAPATSLRGSGEGDSSSCWVVHARWALLAFFLAEFV